MRGRHCRKRDCTLTPWQSRAFTRRCRYWQPCSCIRQSFTAVNVCKLRWLMPLSSFHSLGFVSETLPRGRVEFSSIFHNMATRVASDGTHANASWKFMLIAIQSNWHWVADLATLITVEPHVLPTDFESSSATGFNYRFPKVPFPPANDQWSIIQHLNLDGDVCYFGCYQRARFQVGLFNPTAIFGGFLITDLSGVQSTPSLAFIGPPWPGWTWRWSCRPDVGASNARVGRWPIRMTDFPTVSQPSPGAQGRRRAIRLFTAECVNNEWRETRNNNQEIKKEMKKTASCGR